MIEINGKIYRNLQEQVLKNKEDIEELKEGGAGSGISEERVNQLIATAAIKRNGSNSPTNDISWNDKGIVELGFIELDEKTAKPSPETDIWKDSASQVHVTCPLVADYGMNAGGLPVTNVGAPSNPNDAATKTYVDTAVANAGGGGGGGGGGFSQRQIIQGGTYSTGSLLSEFTGSVEYNESARIIHYTTGLTESFYADPYGDNYINFDISGSFNLSSGGVVHGFVSGMSADGSGRVVNNVVGNYSDYGYGYGNINLYMPLGGGIAGEDDISLTLFLGG